MTDEQETTEEDLEEDVSEEAAEEEETDAAESEADGLQSGNFVRLAYTARTAEDGQLVDTTDPDVAEEEGVDEEGQEFSPRVLVLGEGHLFEPVEEDIVGKEVGDTGEVVVSAEEAFGEHDPDQVRTVSADKISEDERYPGAHVHIDGDHGYVQSIIGGRARVDFNHPLAGQDIEYEYEIVDVVEDRLERAKGLLSTYIDLDLEMRIETDEVEEEQIVEPDEDEEDADEKDADAEEDEADEDADDESHELETETELVEKETLYIEATPQLTMNQQWMFSKQQIAQELIDRVDVDRVIVQEVIEGMGAGPMGGMMGGMGDMGGEIEDALEDVDVDAEELVEELDEE